MVKLRAMRRLPEAYRSSSGALQGFQRGGLLFQLRAKRPVGLDRHHRRLGSIAASGVLLRYTQITGTSSSIFKISAVSMRSSVTVAMADTPSVVYIEENVVGRERMIRGDSGHGAAWRRVDGDTFTPQLHQKILTRIGRPIYPASSARCSGKCLSLHLVSLGIDGIYAPSLGEFRPSLSEFGPQLGEFTSFGFNLTHSPPPSRGAAHQWLPVNGCPSMAVHQSSIETMRQDVESP